MKANLRLATILAVTFLGAISAQANDYSAAGANAYVQSKDYPGLLKYATAWSKAEPNNADAWSYLGVVYGIYLKQPDKAVGPMLQSLKLNPNQAPGWHALGITYIQLKKNADAVSAISHAIKLNPNQPNYYNNLAAAYAANIVAIYQSYRWNAYVEEHRQDPKVWHGLVNRDDWQNGYLTGDPLAELTFWMGAYRPATMVAVPAAARIKHVPEFHPTRIAAARQKRVAKTSPARKAVRRTAKKRR